MSEPSTNAPAPSKHVFLHEIPNQAAGAKVRFLCCTIDYDVSKGHLVVDHAYPCDTNPTPTAIVDINLVLQTIGGRLLEPGRWINVIGYVQQAEVMHMRPSSVSKRKQSKQHLGNGAAPPLVQAVLIWDAGPVKVEEYEKVMEAQKDAWRKTRHLYDAYK